MPFFGRCTPMDHPDMGEVHLHAGLITNKLRHCIWRPYPDAVWHDVPLDLVHDVMHAKNRPEIARLLIAYGAWIP